MGSKSYTAQDMTDKPTAFQLEIAEDHKKSFGDTITETLYVNDGVSVLFHIGDEPESWVRVYKPIYHMKDGDTAQDALNTLFNDRT
jgi:hypothetical protein